MALGAGPGEELVVGLLLDDARRVRIFLAVLVDDARVGPEPVLDARPVGRLDARDGRRRRDRPPVLLAHEDGGRLAEGDGADGARAALEVDPAHAHEVPVLERHGGGARVVGVGGLVLRGVRAEARVHDDDALAVRPLEGERPQAVDGERLCGLVLLAVDAPDRPHELDRLADGLLAVEGHDVGRAREPEVGVAPEALRQHLGDEVVERRDVERVALAAGSLQGLEGPYVEGVGRRLRDRRQLRRRSRVRSLFDAPAPAEDERPDHEAGRHGDVEPGLLLGAESPLPFL